MNQTEVINQTEAMNQTEVINQTEVMNQYVIKHNRKLRCGYTTGSCAAGAAKAGASMLLSGQPVTEVAVAAPKGTSLLLSVVETSMNGEEVTCAIKKDSGDDPDITNGILIYATVAKSTDNQIRIDGGTGVGLVTKPGLSCKVGEPAINPVPKQMILSEVQKVCENHQYTGGLHVTISVPEGEALAKKTFNPRLGIVGGISILGTTGIVEPMSEAALIETIRININQQKAKGTKTLLVCPGNYGETFIRKELKLRHELVLCSNYIGEMLDFTLELGFERMLLIGHAGKLVKLAAGIMNTHSRWADCRMELLALHAALIGADTVLVKEIMECLTTEDAIGVLDKNQIRDAVLESIMKKIDFYLQHRVGHQVQTGVILFSNEKGILGMTEHAGELLEQLRKEETDEQ